MELTDRIRCEARYSFLGPQPIIDSNDNHGLLRCSDSLLLAPFLFSLALVFWIYLPFLFVLRTFFVLR